MVKIVRKLEKFESLQRAHCDQKGFHPFLRSLKQMRQSDPVEMEMIKYGFVKTKLNTKVYYATGIGFLMAVALSKYCQQLYRNQMRTLQPIAEQNQQHSSVLVNLRRIIGKVVFAVERYFFIGELGNKKKKPGQLIFNTEAIMRIEQYRYYQKNRDKSLDFINIGVVHKYPFPKDPQNMAKMDQ